MGCMFSFLSKFYCFNKDEAKAISNQIDKEIILELKNEPDEIEVLILGPCESGKTTFMSQMRLIHQSDFTLEERLMYKPVVHANAIQSMAMILNKVEYLAIQVDQHETTFNAYKFFRILEERTSQSHTLVEDVKVTPDLAVLMSQIWQDSGIQQAFYRSDEFYLPDNTGYFLSNIDRISDPSYVPSTQDILYSRLKTNGVCESKILIKGMMFTLHDIGEQQSARRKWLNLFDCVHAVAFCVSLTSYYASVAVCTDHPSINTPNQNDQAGSKVNQMRESLKLFSAISNNRIFLDATMIVLLTKSDIFKDKIKRRPITDAFPEYTGRQEYEPCLQFILNSFKEQKKSGPPVSCHTLITTDTNNTRFAVSAITDLLIKNFLKDCGIY